MKIKLPNEFKVVNYDTIELVTENNRFERHVILGFLNDKQDKLCEFADRKIAEIEFARIVNSTGVIIVVRNDEEYKEKEKIKVLDRNLLGI